MIWRHTTCHPIKAGGRALADLHGGLELRQSHVSHPRGKKGRIAEPRSHRNTAHRSRTEPLRPEARPLADRVIRAEFCAPPGSCSNQSELRAAWHPKPTALRGRRRRPALDRRPLFASLPINPPGQFSDGPLLQLHSECCEVAHLGKSRGRRNARHKRNPAANFPAAVTGGAHCISWAICDAIASTHSFKWARKEKGLKGHDASCPSRSNKAHIRGAAWRCGRGRGSGAPANRDAPTRAELDHPPQGSAGRRPRRGARPRAGGRGGQVHEPHNKRGREWQSAQCVSCIWRQVGSRPGIWTASNICSDLHSASGMPPCRHSGCRRRHRQPRSSNHP